MHENVYKGEIISELDEKIKNGYKVILYNLDNENVLKTLYEVSVAKKDKVVIWTTMDCFDDNSVVKLISPDSMEEILQMYFLYEFTDSLLVLSENSVYPGIVNYVSQNIMTEIEVIETFFI